MPNIIHLKRLMKLKCIIFIKMFLFKEHSNPTSSSLDLVNSRKWKRHQSVDIPDYPRCLRNVGNQLYQCHRNGISVYDAQLKEVKSIPNGDNVYDLCDMPNGDLVVASGYGLYHTKGNGEFSSFKCNPVVIIGLIFHLYFAMHQHSYIKTENETNRWILDETIHEGKPQRFMRGIIMKHWLYFIYLQHVPL